MFDWSKYAVGGAKRPDSFTGLNPNFSTALSQMLQAAEAELGQNALSITSAYRSPEKQAELYQAALKKYGSPAAARKWVAPPGRSMHNKGLAVDFGAAGGGLLRDPNSREAQWLKANASRFGLDVPMSWEPWQVELAGARKGKKIASETMSLLDNGPQAATTGRQGFGARSLLGNGPQATTTGRQGAALMMQQEQKPRGLLEGFGVQKMEEGAEGETGQRFYNRDSFKDTAAVLAQGFGRMGIMGMEEIADNIASQRTENKARNKTMDALMKMGTPQAQAAVEYINAGGDPVSALKMAFEKPEQATPSSAIGKLQSDLASGLINQEQYEVALANMAPQGMRIESDGRGGFTMVQGAGASTKPLTEGQSKATGYYGKALQAEKVLSSLETQGTRLYDTLVSNVPIAGNYMISKEYQQYSQAKRNFINSILRQESGAAIGKDEFANAEQQYFPQPGEGASVIAQKAANRRRAIEGLQVAAGEGAGRINSSTPSTVIEYDASGKRIKG